MCVRQEGTACFCFFLPRLSPPPRCEDMQADPGVLVWRISKGCASSWGNDELCQVSNGTTENWLLALEINTIGVLTRAVLVGCQKSDLTEFRRIWMENIWRLWEYTTLSRNFDSEGSKVGQQLAKEVCPRSVFFIYCKMGERIVYFSATGNISRKSGKLQEERQEIMDGTCP